MERNNLDLIIQVISKMPPLPMELPPKPVPPSLGDMYEDSIEPYKVNSRKVWKPSISELLRIIPEHDSLDDYIIMKHESRSGFCLAKKTRAKRKGFHRKIAAFHKKMNSFNAAAERSDDELLEFQNWLFTVTENLPEIIRLASKLTEVKYLRHNHEGSYDDLSQFYQILQYTLNVPRSSLREEFLLSQEEEGEFSSYITRLVKLRPR